MLQLEGSHSHYAQFSSWEGWLVHRVYIGLSIKDFLYQPYLVQFSVLNTSYEVPSVPGATSSSPSPHHESFPQESIHCTASQYLPPLCPPPLRLNRAPSQSPGRECLWSPAPSAHPRPFLPPSPPSPLPIRYYTHSPTVSETPHTTTIFSIAPTADQMFRRRLGRRLCVLSTLGLH